MCAIDLKFGLRSWIILPVLSCILGIAASTLSGCGSGYAVATGASTAPAPAAVKDGPQLGFIWNAPDRSLRPILGIPGASQIGQSLVPAGLYIAGAASSASGSAAALLIESDGSLDLLRLPAGTPARLAVNVTVKASLRFSPTGGSAAAFTPGSNALTLITGLPDKPQPAAIPLAAGINLSDVAVADDGQLAIVAPVSGTLWASALGVDGKVTPVSSLGQLGGLNFLPGSEDLLLGDAGRNALVVIRSIAGAHIAQTVTTPLFNQPLAVAGSRDKRWVLVANSGDANLVRIDLSAQAPPAKLACACTPSLVSPLDGNAVFRVVDITAGPTWFVDAAAAAPQLYFIPAIQLAPAAGGGSTGAAK